MAVGAVVGVLCGTELDLFAKPLFQGKHWFVPRNFLKKVKLRLLS
jgi:hypothetical protein